MASLEQTVKLILDGEYRLAGMFDTAGGQISALSRKLSGLNNSVGDMTAPFASLAGGVLKIDAALTALAAGGLAYAFSKSKDFENASIELKKVLGEYPEALAEAEKYARSLSGTYGESASEILESTANFKQAGFDIKESMGLTKSALDLVIAGNIDAAKSSDLLVSALKGFRAPAEDATRLIDILNEVSNNYATDVEQLAVGMAELSPIASIMGFSMEETAGVLTPVIEIFRSGGEAAVALKTGLLRLVDDNASVTQALASIGVAQEDANGKLRSGKDILADVAAAFTTLDQNQKLFVASQIVGVQQAARMVTVFDNLGKTSEITATAMQAAGSAAVEVTARLSSGEVAVNRFTQGFVNLAATVGDQFREAAKSAIDGSTDIENALESVVKSGSLDDLFDALEGELSRLGAFLSEVAENLPEAFEKVDFSGLLKSLGGVGDEIADLFDGLDLSTPDGLADTIQKVVDSIEGLTNVTAGMIDGAGPFINTLADIVNSFIELDAESQKSIGNVTGFAGALNKVTSPIGSVLGAVEGLGLAVQTLAGVQVVKLVTGLVGSGGMVSALSLAAKGAGGLITALAGPVGVAAVVGASAVAVGTAINTYNEWQEAEDELEKSLQRGVELQTKLAEQYKDISKATGENISSTQDLQRLTKEGVILFDEQTHSWARATDVQRDYVAEVKAATDRSYDWNKVIKEITNSNGDLASIIIDTTDALSDQQQTLVAEKTAYYEFIGNTKEVAQRMAELEVIGDPLNTFTEGAKKAAKESENLAEKLEKIASNERIKSMELVFDFNIEQLKADTDLTKSLIDGISTTVESTGNLLGDLTGQLSSVSDFSDKWLIEDLIRDENKRRDNALNLQKELTQAEIDLTKARSNALKNGDAMITINGDGLAPELESMMWKVLETIKIRVTEEQSQFLKGIT